MKRHPAMTWAAVVAGLRGGCDQSINYSRESRSL
jgi:hypothetical protein